MIARLVIFTVNQDIGLSAGNQLCGNLTGQHGKCKDDVELELLNISNFKVYLDVDPINIKDPIRLFVFAGNEGSTPYKWNIKITLIDCMRNEEIQGIHFNFFVHSSSLQKYFHFPAPAGCRQYYNSLSGSFESFNFG